MEKQTASRTRNAQGIGALKLNCSKRKRTRLKLKNNKHNNNQALIKKSLKIN